jgi:hypothetical protein
LLKKEQHEEVYLDNKTKIYETLVYMSRDVHNNILSYKSDIESLFYCLILSVYKSLPWEKHLHYPIKKLKLQTNAINF